MANGLYFFGSEGAYGIGAAVGGLAGLAQQGLNNLGAYQQQAAQQNMMNPFGRIYNSPPNYGLLGAQQSADTAMMAQGVGSISDSTAKQKAPEEPYRATDEFEDAYFKPKWRRRLEKRYPEGCVIGGFVQRLALEIDMWHANAAGLPA